MLLCLALIVTVSLLGTETFAVNKENAKKTGFFWQLTDVHYDSNYSTTLQNGTDFCHGKAAGTFGDYRCDSPWKLVQSAIGAMKSLKSDVDFIMWTGDNAPHVPDQDINPTKVLVLVKNVTDLLRNTFPNSKIFPTIGNHDEWPANEVPIKSDQYFNSVLADSGWEYLLEKQSIETFRKGGYYVEDYGPWRIFGLNTIIWYSANSLIGNASDPAEQILWLDKELLKAKKAKKKVIFTGHVPPGYSADRPNKVWYVERFNQQFNKLLQQFRDITEAGIFGHEHTDSFRIAYSEAGEPIVPIFMAPSVTPWNASWDNIGGPNNPSIRLYRYNNETGNILDYTQYYLNLTKANQNRAVDWEIEYSFTDTYKVKNANASSLHHLLKDFQQPNSYAFKNYYKYFSVSYNISSDCDDKCKLGHLCGISCIGTELYKKCLNHTENHHKVTPAPIDPVRPIPRYVYYTVGGLVFLAVLVFLLVAIFCCRRGCEYNTREQQGYVRVGVNS